MKKKNITILSVLAVVALSAAIYGVQNLPAQETVAVLRTAVAPVNGTSEVQTLTFGSGITGGTFKLKYNNSTTKTAIAWSPTNATLVSNIDTALEKLNPIGTGGVTTAVGTMTDGIGTITLTFGGKLARLDVPEITIPTNSLTGETHVLSIATTTPGVTGDGRDYGPGVLAYNVANKAFHVNNGTLYNPNWAVALPLATATPAP